VPYDKEQCINIETSYRHGWDGARVWGKDFSVGQDEELKCVINFEDMTVSIVGTEWVSAVRRSDRDEVMAESWDHQVANVSILDVEPEWRDYKVGESVFFDRARSDKKPPRISRNTHTIVKMRRVQDRMLLRQFEAQRKSLEGQRGKDQVELTREYAWHGSGTRKPDDVAAGKEFMLQVVPSLTPNLSPLAALSLLPTFAATNTPHLHAIVLMMKEWSSTATSKASTRWETTWRSRLATATTRATSTGRPTSRACVSTTPARTTNCRLAAGQRAAWQPAQDLGGLDGAGLW
jgi:hypothetical protein